jgi:hypothetical protein
MNKRVGFQSGVRSSGSAEKSVEGTALRTRLGVKPMAADQILAHPQLTPLFVIEPPECGHGGRASAIDRLLMYTIYI